MSSIYNPQGGVPTPAVGARTRFTILSSTNTAPISVTFVSPTTIQDQDTIEIEGHLVNTAANGVWVATKTTASVFTLNGSTGNGNGGQTGYAIDYTVNPLFTLPGDGDLASAASINAPMEGNANAIPWGYKNAGIYKLYDIYNTDFSNPSGWAASTVASTTYAPVIVNGPGFGLFNFTSGTNPAPPATQSGDIFECFLSVQALCSTSSQSNGLTLGLSTNGGSFTSLGSGALFQTSTIVTGATILIKTNSLAAVNVFDFAIMINSTSGASATFIGGGVGHLLVNHYRPL